MSNLIDKISEMLGIVSQGTQAPTQEVQQQTTPNTENNEEVIQPTIDITPLQETMQDILDVLDSGQLKGRFRIIED